MPGPLYWFPQTSEWFAEETRGNYWSSWKLYPQTRNCLWLLLQAALKPTDANKEATRAVQPRRHLQGLPLKQGSPNSNLQVGSSVHLSLLWHEWLLPFHQGCFQPQLQLPKVLTATCFCMEVHARDILGQQTLCG